MVNVEVKRKRPQYHMQCTIIILMSLKLHNSLRIFCFEMKACYCQKKIRKGQ